LTSLLGPRLHIGFIDLYDVGTGREQVLDLGVHRSSIVKHHLLLVFVEIVLRLLGHSEWSGHSDLDRAVSVGAQELNVAHFNRLFAADLADNARHWVWMAGPVERGAWIVNIDTLKRSGEAVRVAFAALFTVRNDIEAGVFLVANSEKRRIVLRFFQKF
jgi:hypothetical protein